MENTIKRPGTVCNNFVLRRCIATLPNNKKVELFLDDISIAEMLEVGSVISVERGEFYSIEHK